MMSEVVKSAVISDCGRYRYSLTRRWADGPVMLFVMLNPSTADSAQDDPTIRRCIGFAIREGCGSIEAVNAFAYRATDPAALRDAARGMDVGGPLNLWHVRAALSRASIVVAAWGANPVTGSRVPDLLAEVEGCCCLGVTSSGAPRHPLFVRADQPLVPWGRHE